MLPTEEFGEIHANCQKFLNWTVKHATVCGFDSDKISETARANVTARCSQMDPLSHLLVMITSQVTYLCMAAHPASPRGVFTSHHNLVYYNHLLYKTIIRSFTLPPLNLSSPQYLLDS